MNLYLLRHAKAAPLGGRVPVRDRDRPLLPEGESRMRQAAQGMRRLDLGLQRILSSPYLRARQTAQITAAALDLADRLVFSDALASGAPPELMLDEILRQSRSIENLLVVGHEPALSDLITRLTTPEGRLNLEMKKAALCKLSTNCLRPGPCATLEWLLLSKQLAMLGKD